MGGEIFDVSKLKPKFNFATQFQLRLTATHLELPVSLPLPSTHFTDFMFFLAKNCVTIIIIRKKRYFVLVAFISKKIDFMMKNGALDGTVQTYPRNLLLLKSPLVGSCTLHL